MSSFLSSRRSPIGPPPLPASSVYAAVALPLLDAMTPLRAADVAKPRRSVFVYIPNGVNGMTWQVTKPRP